MRTPAWGGRSAAPARWSEREPGQPCSRTTGAPAPARSYSSEKPSTGRLRGIAADTIPTGRDYLRERALDLARLVGLQHVALLDVLEVREHDAALEAGRDLAHVVVEALERVDRRVVDDRAVAHHADPRAAADDAVGDVAARDRADPRGAERRADLDGADGLLDLLRREHALHGVAQVVERLVDHRVAADLHAFALGGGARVADRANVEAEDHRVGRGGEHDVGLADAADAAAHDVDLDLALRQAGDLVLEGLERAGDVRLEHEVEILDGALLDAAEDLVEGDLAPGAAGLRLVAQPDGALVGLLAGGAVVLDHAERVAGVGDAIEAQDLDRLAGHGLLKALAPIVLHRADAAPVGAGDDRVADLERAALDQHGHDRAAAGVELGLDDDARRVRVRVCLEVLELGDDEDRLEEVVEVLVRLGGHVDELGVAAPLGRLQAALRELGAHARGVGALLVDLVDRDQDRHLGRLGVVDRLVGLRLHAVVGGDDDHRDVGDLRAAGAHGGERLVARRVEEGDGAAVVLDLVGADVLRDAAGLALDDVRLADRVEQRRLAVLDVAHDRDDRRALAEILVGVLEGRLVVDGVVGVDDLDLLLERLGEHADGLVGERLGQRDHLAHHHQLLDDLGHRDAEVLGDVLDRRARVDPDDVGARRRLLVQRRGGLGEDVAAATTAPARALLRPGRSAAGAARSAGAARPAARGLRVDDHAAGAAAGAALGAHAPAGRPAAGLRRRRLGLVARRALLGLGRGDDLRAGAGGGRALGGRDARLLLAPAAGLRGGLLLGGGLRGLGLGRGRGRGRGRGLRRGACRGRGGGRLRGGRRLLRGGRGGLLGGRLLRRGLRRRRGRGGLLRRLLRGRCLRGRGGLGGCL